MLSFHASGRNAEIEALRAVAVIIVIIGHGGELLGWKEAPFARVLAFFGGVDLFFVISGYVIASAYVGQFTKVVGDKSAYWRLVVAFWIRRFYRILPSSWLWLIIVIVLATTYNSTQVFGGVRGGLGDFIAVVLNIANFHFAKCVVPDVWCGSNGVYWSLSLEEQFYFCFPFVLLLPRRYMVLCLSVIIVIYLFVPRTTMIWFTRIDGISLGVLLAIFRSSEVYALVEPRLFTSRPARLFAAVFLISAIVIVPGSTGLVSFYPSVVVGVSGLLVLIASYDKSYLFASGILRTVLVWIGERSFALYLIHNPVFWFIRETQARLFSVETLSPAVLCAVAALLMVALADLNYRFFETPLRNKGKLVATKFAAAEQPVRQAA
ncbi:hypothetical protein B6S44_24215 [Bosea sp. Tri-44]|uniref:acyltransferase family protein n=1 Tax=Bosea sp. Tri-44 TaxID=1972137 RepID=UPI00100F15A5|nr:acyltransferase [Bosea sp. Tri-44]RXT48173.1 hypothetical protein B6S44_24215 [Bosea sp. Tri-44]